MKKFSIYLSLTLLLGHSCFSQNATLSQMERMLISVSVHTPDSILKTFGYYLDDSKKLEEGGTCREMYIFKRAVTEGNFYEIVRLLRPCENAGINFFNELRLLTRSEAFFLALKKECESSTKMERKGEGIEGDYFVERYKKGNVLFFFRNGKDQNVKAYIIDLVYDYSFLPGK